MARRKQLIVSLFRFLSDEVRYFTVSSSSSLVLVFRFHLHNESSVLRENRCSSSYHTRFLPRSILRPAQCWGDINPAMVRERQFGVHEQATC